MPGSRRYEVEQLIPFFFTAALAIRREDPAMPIAFGISPFTTNAAVRSAVEAGGDARMYSQRGRMIESPDGPALASLDGTQTFPILRNSLAAAARARLTVTIPGTKVIELAAIGAPVLSCTPINMAEIVAINGPLTYLDRIPFAGRRLKQIAVTAVARRFRFHTQPNIDANEDIVRELRGTLTPGRVARVTLERYDDREWLRATGARLELLYAAHAGAADRMAAETGRRPSAIACDVTREADVQRLFERALDVLGAIDVLVNNAGLGGTANVADMTDEQWSRVLDVTLTGTFRCMRAALKPMIARKAGVIVNNASVLGWRAQAGQAHYAASKAGVMALTRCAAMEAAPHGVRVNAVSPSLAMHPFLAKVTTAELLDELTSREAFGRAAEPWEVANVIVFLASDYATYMTGECVAVSSQHP